MYVTQRTTIIMAAIASLALLTCLGAGAQGGGGSGGGKSQPLSLSSSEPADGADGLSMDADIVLVFNKNVVNMAVSKGNAAQFELRAKGKIIPIEVRMADDQMQPELKERIVLHPKEPLAPSTEYVLTIGAGLGAKNGSFLGKAISLSFMTAAKR